MFLLKRLLSKKNIPLFLINDLIVRLEKAIRRHIEKYMNKLFILTIFVFAVACRNTTNVVETREVQSNYPSKSWSFFINKEEPSAPTVFIQPYQRVVVNCYEQPCIAFLAGNVFSAKYNGKNFIIDLTTSDIDNEKTIKVADHQYIEVSLANDAYADRQITGLTVTPLSDAQIQTIKKQTEDEQWARNVKFYSAIGVFVAGFFIVATIIGFQMLKIKAREEDAELRRKQAERNRAAQRKAEREAKEKEAKENVTPEDILNHVNG